MDWVDKSHNYKDLYGILLSLRSSHLNNFLRKTLKFVYDDWMQEITQLIIKLHGLLLPDLLVKKCSYQTSL